MKEEFIIYKVRCPLTNVDEDKEKSVFYMSLKLLDVKATGSK